MLNQARVQMARNKAKFCEAVAAHGPQTRPSPSNFASVNDGGGI